MSRGDSAIVIHLIKTETPRIGEVNTIQLKMPAHFQCVTAQILVVHIGSHTRGLHGHACMMSHQPKCECALLQVKLSPTVL